MEFILTIALVYGITFSLKDATLLSRPRDWVKGKSEFLSHLLRCPFCTGFHSGWLSFLLLRQAGLGQSVEFWAGLAIYAFMGASVSYVLDTTMLRLEGDD